jgi:pimeloyl-ACP methyl ester carboxylesterase
LPLEAYEKETSVRVDGISSPLLEAGPREAVEAVVFVHGNPGSIADWTRLVANVGEFARAVAMDMPGFGAESTIALKQPIIFYHDLTECALVRCELGHQRVEASSNPAQTSDKPRGVAAHNLAGNESAERRGFRSESFAL